MGLSPLAFAALLACQPGGGGAPQAPSSSADVRLGEGDTARDDSGETARADMDGDGHIDGDCAETDPTIHPGAAELCNGIDDDCDGAIDAGAVDARTWFADLDGDGFGDEANTAIACWALVDFTLLGGDCDDARADVNPDATDRCDGVDDNCYAGEFDAVDAIVAYEDGDADGFGFLPRTVCDPAGLVLVDGDCQDADASSFPGADEWCDGADNDCDGDVDEEALDALPFYRDADGDTLGDALDIAWSCTPPTGSVADASDCDDSDAGVGGPLVWFQDDDGDGYGTTSTVACTSPGAGAGVLGGDCDDADPAAWPGAPESCDTTADLDCDGLVGTDDLDGDGLQSCDDCDDGDATLAGPTAWHVDRDGDGFGDPAQYVDACAAPTRFVADATDCNDASSVSWPGAAEVWYDDEDEDCAGGDDWDQDLDGYSADADDCVDTEATVNPAGTETCGNHLDDDCDGTDNGCAESGTQSLADADVVLPSSARVAHLGYAWSAAPDFYGPGDSWVAVSTAGVDSGRGAVHFAHLTDLLLDGAAATWTATWEGEASGDKAGGALSSVGDFDGDGTEDLLVNATTRGVGSVYLIPVASTGTQSLASAAVRLDGLSGSWMFGMSIAAVDDLDGDGTDEFVVSDMYGGDAGPLHLNRGCAHFFAGPIPAITALRTGQLCGDLDGMGWGQDVRVADLQGDGLPELILTSSYARGTVEHSGKVAFLELPFSGSLTTDAADFYVEGTSGNDPIEAAAGVGDLNGDGYEDLYTGHSATSTVADQAGSARVYFGPLSTTLSADDAEAALYGTRENEWAGEAASAGDLDGDGAADLLLAGASGASEPLAGRLGVFYGPIAGTATLDEADLLLEGEEGQDEAGAFHLGPGDLNGDGYGDLLIGAPSWGSDSEGRAYVWLGAGG